MRVGVGSAAVVLVIASGGVTAGAVKAANSPPVTPANATATLLSGVSCAGSDCTAVGQFEDKNGNGLQTLAERRHAGSWAIEPTFAPLSSASDQWLMAVSCPSSTICEAVGDNTGGDFPSEYFAEGWTGKRWRLQNVPEPADDLADVMNPPNENLAGISCSKPAFCIAVGSYTDTAGSIVPLTARWNGKSWKVLARAKVPGGGSLDAVSCAAADACVAVGGTLIERWNGRLWTVERAVKPRGAHHVSLVSVSCSSTQHCVVAGSYSTPNGARRALVEASRGDVWVIQTTPQINGVLSSVSCATRTACMAVGSFNFGGNRTALAELWNGHKWKRHGTPGASTPGELNAISCTGASGCMAVGDEGKPTAPLVVVY